MLKLAFEAGLSPSEFWGATWDDVWCFIDAYHRRELNEWKRTREVITMIYNTAQGRKGRAKTSKELMPMPDEIKERKEIDREQIFRAMRIQANQIGINVGKWQV